MSDMTYLLDGRLALGDYGEASDILYCGHRPVAEWAETFLPDNKQVSIRYWVTDKPVSLEEAQREAVEQIMGKTEILFGARYSEITGYLWTDEDFNVGGHDMIARLKGDEGKYLLLEVVVHT